MERLEGKVAFITGASSGIGAALAREYAARGADVVLAARRRERLDELAEEIEARGRRALAVACDVTRDGDLEAAVATALERLGRIDHLVANAGFGVASWFHKLEVEDYRRQLETNVFGVLRTVYAGRDALLASRGCLVIMGSINSFVALPGSSPYAMSKHAVRALAEALRYELGPHGVDVVLLAPGFVDSEIRQVDNQGRRHPGASDPIPRWLRMDTAEAARKLVRGIRRRRRVVVVTGHGRLVVLLQRWAPWLLAMLVRRFGMRPRRRPEDASSG